MDQGVWSEAMIPQRMIVVSNRLPVTINCSGDQPRIQASTGGLVTALDPILRQFGGCWIGWTGSAHDHRLARLIGDWSASHEYSVHPVFMSAAEKTRFYDGCCNQIIWPLFHGLPSRCCFESAYWQSYRTSNEKFARAVETIWNCGDLVWVQDYHLMLVSQNLRGRGLDKRIAYFHHIPFPPPDIFETLPWRAELLFGLLHYDLIGFQTPRDVRNFVSSVRRCLPDTRVSHSGKNLLVKTRGLSATVGPYPISIDFDEFCAGPMPAIPKAATKIILGVDRLDYTKGIPQRLSAFRMLLEKHEELRGRVTLFQIVVPSREDIPEYRRLKFDIQTMVSEINGEYGTPSWTPIQYFHRSIPRDELLAFYRTADVALVTPLRDGMNIVAKEFCASRTENRGVLVLSEFAGAAEELGAGALLVNPNDIDAVACALHSALTMNEAEQQSRMQTMRHVVRSHDVYNWAGSFIRDAVHSGPAAVRTAVQVAGD
jgi:alpha,alpha-trehalose-phosphate synthase [UDP-forming]